MSVLEIELSWEGVEASANDSSNHDLVWPGWDELVEEVVSETIISLSFSESENTFERSATASEEIEEAFVRNQETESVATASDEIKLDAFNVLESEAVSQSEAFSSSLTLFTVIDSGVARETVFSGSMTLSVSEAIAEEIIDSFTQTVAESVGQVSELLDAFTLSVRTLTSNAAATDAVFSASGTDVEDVAQAVSENFSSVSQTLVSEAEATDEFELVSMQAGERLVSTAAASDEPFLQTETHAQLTSTAVAFETILHKEPCAVAWVMNTETAAPSWYSNWQFSDMVQVGDKILAVGPEGLVVLGADTDAGETIDAVVQYGFTDFGSEQRKRVPEFVFGYTAETPMAVEVETYGQGYPPYEYQISAQRLSEQPNNGRLTPGKGLNARYWRIAVRNTDGGAFSVNSITATVAESTRRL